MQSLKKYSFLLLLLLLVPAVSQAQSVELTPFVGLRSGGDFSTDTFDFFDVDLEIDDGESQGLIVGFDLTKNLQLEFLVSRQETKLTEDGGLFLDDDVLFDLDVDYYHVGMLYQWKPGNIHPFVAASVGATRLTPAPGDLDDETRFSTSIGGGVKVMFGDHFGLRLEARAFSTFVDEDDRVFCDNRRNCDYYDYDDEFLIQGEARAGLIIAF